MVGSKRYVALKEKDARTLPVSHSLATIHILIEMGLFKM